MKSLNIINDLERIKQEPDRNKLSVLIAKLIDKFSNGRDVVQHRHFWKMASIVAENTTDINWNTAKKVVNQCKIELRFIDSFFYYDNPNKPDEQKLQLEFRSISFAKCSQEDFDVFFDGAVKIMANKLNVPLTDLLQGVV